MSEIKLPRIIYSGMDSLDNLFNNDYENVLIITDGRLSQKSGALMKIQRKFDSLFTRNHTIIQDDAHKLFRQAEKYTESRMPEVIIAIGDGKTIDCGSAVSHLCSVPLISIAESLPGQLTEFDTLDVFLYKNPGEIHIADPSFIYLTDSQQIAYSGLGMACLALEACVVCGDRFVKEIGEKSFYEILKNILPAYRGEISARENLCNAMFWAYIAFLNSFEYSWQSASYRTASFFSQWCENKISCLAVCVTSIADYLNDNFQDRYISLANNINLTHDNENKVQALNDEIRRIQATMAVPYAMKNMAVPENEFSESTAELSDEDKDLFFRCLFGNITFIKS